MLVYLVFILSSISGSGVSVTFFNVPQCFCEVVHYLCCFLLTVHSPIYLIDTVFVNF